MNRAKNAALANDPKALEVYRKEYQKKSRDNARTPVQWDDGKNAGFTSAEKPWMAVNPNYSVINAAAQLDKPSSVFNCWKTVLEARKKYKDIIVYGRFDLVDENNEKIFAYTQTSPEGKILVACNFSTDTVEWQGYFRSVQEVIVSTTGQTLQCLEGGRIVLEPYEAIGILVSN